jgi:TatD DNase family protein
MWLDSHCHITADEFAEDRAAVLDAASADGVESFIAIGSGYGVGPNARAVALAAIDPRVFAAVGVHPHEATELDDEGRASLRGWLDSPRVVALGECGLDYHYMNSPREVQRPVLAEQLALAKERDVPVSIHVRGDEPDAFGEMLDIWNAEGRGELQGVLHCYTGSLDFARRAIDAGFYVSFSGIITFKRSQDLRDTARQVPLDRLMVETDSPFLAPEGHRGRRNEPAWLGLIGEVLAELHGVTAQAMASVTEHNARTFYRLDQAEARRRGTEVR